MQQFMLFPSDALSGPARGGQPERSVQASGAHALPLEIRSLQKATIQGDTLLAPEDFRFTPIRRLVVIVPTDEFDESHLAARLWNLAKVSTCHVVYLALAGKPESEASQRRRLAVLVSLTGGSGVRAEAALSSEPAWLDALAPRLAPGDLLVSLAGHRVSGWGARRQPLGVELVGALDAPVFMLGGVTLITMPVVRARLQEALIWAVSLMLVAAFFVLQYNIDQALKRPAAVVLIMLSLLVEGAALLKVNQWTGFTRK